MGRYGNAERYENAESNVNAESLSYERKFPLRTHRIMLTLIEMDFTEPIPTELAKKK